MRATRRGGFFIKALVPMLCFALTANGQDTLKAVEVSAPRNVLSQLGKRTETIDSLAREQFRYSSVGDLLGANSQVFIKSYGPGALATTAFRGGNASQTAVLWNGFNLQNAMLGQADLALMPSLLFENVEVEYGGSSSLWGSGAVGGSIHLNNRNLFGQGLRANASFGGGSFGLFNAAVSALVSKSRFLSSTKAYLLSSENNYLYKDSLDKEQPLKRQKHAAYDFKGLMQEFKWLLNPRQVLSLNAWINTNQRQLPAYNPREQSRAYQQDNALRFTANWTYIKRSYRSAIKAAWFSDRIDYTDSAVALYSKSTARTLMLENENYLDWGRAHQFNSGLSVQSSRGRSDNYASSKGISRVSLLVGNKFSIIKNKLLLYAGARAEYFSVGRLPVTGNVSVDYKPHRNLTLGLNAARVYRQPTLNELYWIPGGNVNLKPEEGYSVEGSATFARQWRGFGLLLSGSAYSRRINNWILWVPGRGGNPSPLNIQQVWSRGTESSSKLQYTHKKLRLALVASSAYVLSTVNQNAQENNASEGRQLIYTPRYLLNGSFTIGYSSTALSFYHQYTGYRFIASDNSAWLQPYHVSSLRLNHFVKLKNTGYSVYAACNNLFSNSYSIIAGRPMPLRNYELGISIRINKQNNKP